MRHALRMSWFKRFTVSAVLICVAAALSAHAQSSTPTPDPSGTPAQNAAPAADVSAPPANPTAPATSTAPATDATTTPAPSPVPTAPAADVVVSTEKDAYTPVGWKRYNYAADGFSVAFPMDPAIQKKDVPTDAWTFELRTYLAKSDSTALFLGVIDYGATAESSEPDALLQGVKAGFVKNISGKIVMEKPIAFTEKDKHGLDFTTETDSMYFSTRLYLMGTTLYQAHVASPLKDKFGDPTLFLDSFKLIERNASAAPTVEAGTSPIPDAPAQPAASTVATPDATAPQPVTSSVPMPPDANSPPASSTAPAPDASTPSTTTSAPAADTVAQPASSSPTSDTTAQPATSAPATDSTTPQ